MFKLSLAVLFFMGQMVFADLRPPGFPHPPQFPGNPQPPPNNPPPPNYPPQPPPNYPPSNPDYGPGYTSFWQDVGTIKAPKVVEEDVSIDARYQYVNEIALRVSNAPLQISGAWAYLASGYVVELRNFEGQIPPERDFIARLDYYNSLRLTRIVLRVSSPQIIGPSAKAQVYLGIAR